MFRQSSKTRQLPKHVYKHHKFYVLRPYHGVTNGKIVRGTPIKLCGIEQPISVVWEKYNSMMNSKQRTLGWMLDKYRGSKSFIKLSLGSQKNRQYEIEKIKNTKVEAPYNTFSNVPLQLIDTVMLREYLDRVESKSTRTLHLTIIRVAWKHAIQYFRNIPDNAALPLEAESSDKCERYVPDALYNAVLAIAGPRAYALMEIGYICRARVGEILNLKVNKHILKEGLLIERQKGSLDEITLWTPRLKKAVKKLRDIRTNPDNPYLLQSSKGTHYKDKDSVKRIWSDLMRKAKSKGIVTDETRFTHKDLKAKGISDHLKLVKELIPDPSVSGHKTASAQNHYIRKPLINEGTR